MADGRPRGDSSERFRNALTASVLLTTCLMCQSAVAAAAANIDWPYPADIPSASAASPGLAGAQPYDIVRFLKTRGPRSVRLSPDGRWLAFLSTITGTPQLFTMPVEGGTPPSQITFGRSVTFFSWTPEGPALLYGSDRDGNEREAYTLITPDGKAERRLLESTDAFLSFGSFSRDGTQLAYSSTIRNGVDFDVYALTLSSGETRQVYQGSFGFFAAGWKPDGSQLLLSETRGEDGNNLYLLDLTTGAVRVLFKPRINAAYRSFNWVADGSGFYLVTDHEREFAGLAFYELGTGILEYLEAPAHDIESAILFGGDRYLAWTVNEGGYSRIEVRDLEADQLITVPDFPPGTYDLSGSREASVLSVWVMGPRTPGEAWLWQLGAAATGGEPRRVLLPTLAGIEPDSLVAPEIVKFSARDGVTLHGLLYRPVGEDDANPPLMLQVHGGPSGQARPRFDPVAQYLVGRGYAVFDLNFRGSTGYGKTFARLDNGRLRPNAVRDIEDAVMWLGDNASVDPTRMAIMGGSYGGYLTNAAVGEYPGLFKAAVSFVGVSDWVRALEDAPPALKASDRVEYGDIDDPADRAFFTEISPISKAHRIRTPMLVVHGANDPRDPVSESDRLVRAVREQEVDVRYLRFPDEGHMLRKLGNRITAYREIADFLDEQLQ